MITPMLALKMGVGKLLLKNELLLLRADETLGRSLVTLGETIVVAGDPYLGNTYCQAGNLILRAVNLRKIELGGAYFTNTRS